MANRGWVLVGIGAWLALASPVWAQSAPDAQRDPVRWLTTNLGGAACVVYDVGPSPFRLEHVTENTEVQFDGCRMILQQANVVGTRSELRTFQIPLDALSPGAVTATAGFLLPDGWASRGDVPTHTITIAAPAGQSAIETRVEQFDTGTIRDERTEVVTMLVRHEDNAVQIVRALTSAIALCHQR